MSGVRQLKIITLIFLGGGVLLFVLFAFALSDGIGSIRPIEDIQPPADPALKWKVEKIHIGSSVDITGWAFYPGESILIYGTHLVLRDVKTGALYRLPTKMVIREDLNKQYPSSFNYASGGFLARARTDQLPAPLSRYELCIQYFNNHQKIFINTHRNVQQSGERTSK
ncbi:hypothetical protein ABNN70_05425 [Sporolactobacillus sp. Y61]|uniref:Uncharacterized protein n=1 Tax=Sporolactobacillus sp. Y61 TaxID=3160863 RepID=A0AAU8II59_9BACL